MKASTEMLVVMGVFAVVFGLIFAVSGHHWDDGALFGGGLGAVLFLMRIVDGVTLSRPRWKRDLDDLAERVGRLEVQIVLLSGTLSQRSKTPSKVEGAPAR
ncbi:MAG TPA: hypothetical protein VFG59_05410 [Anaeromyxobacter sp.]|nr:hypothetical protein [Anaeromyxobacter sp.]